MSQKGFAPILIFLAVLIAGLLLFGLYKYSGNIIRGSTTKPTSQISQPSPTSDKFGDNLNWKTYAGNGISFEYPDVVSLNQATDQYSDLGLSYKYPGGSDGCEICDGFVLNFKTGYVNVSDFKSKIEQDVKQKSINAYDITPLAQIMINGYTGYTYSYTLEGRRTEIYLSDNLKRYIQIGKVTDDPKIGDTTK